MNCARLLVSVVIPVILGVLAAAGEPEAKAPPAAKAVEIPMRDGKSLAADLYLPAAAGPDAKFPTILIQTPYNRALYSRPGNEHAGRTLLDREHYAYVILDWRGFYGSKAAGPVGTGRARGQDGFDAVEWIAKQEWSDGKVGTWGASALGKVQYDTAAAKPPHLVCCVPLVSGFGQSYDDFYGGGVFKKAYADNMKLIGWGTIAQFAEGHPLRDGLWKLAEAAPDFGKLDVPMLLVSGWSDHGTDQTLATFRRLRTEGGEKSRRESRLLVGPWEHSAVDSGSLGEFKFPEAEGAAAKAAMQFFDYWLREKKDNGLEKIPAVRWYQTGANRWLESPAWPPAGRTETSVYLGADGRLSEEKPAGEAAADELKYDPADPSPTAGGANFALKALAVKGAVAAGPFDQRAKVEGRQDCRLYTSEPLDRDLAFAGSVRAKLFVSTDRADTDFAVRLCDVWPDGRSMLVADGIRRLSLRESFEKESPAKPGEICELTVEMPAAAHTFLQGHRVRAIVTGSNYPRFERNPNNGKRAFVAEEALVATDRLWRGGERPSAVMLPVYSGH
jgi:predicted acyl esterase